MAKTTGSGKLILILFVALIGAAAGYGYFSQTAKLSDEPSVEKTAEAPVDQALLTPKPNDIIIGDNNAIVTMVEYSSLSCPHCANFHETILPTLEKEFITTGKAKLVVRYFPLNEPALKASQVVECAGKTGLKRESFIKVLFDMQQQWAMSESFLKDLKQIALVGGMDSATFDSCVADKDSETQILAARQEAGTKLNIEATPTFFINGMKYEGEYSVAGFRKALEGAGTGNAE